MEIFCSAYPLIKHPIRLRMTLATVGTDELVAHSFVLWPEVGLTTLAGDTEE